ncbi:MAG: hypothetical protein IKK33_04970 [Lachnospiraceae bacterium]|nr:hypothetical protein [Lachnospiraceae bacterium]
MLDDIIEFFLEVVLEFLVEIFPKIKIPRALKRVLSALFLLIVFGGGGLLIGFGIANGTNWMVSLGSVIIVVTSIWLGVQIYRFRR